MAESFRPDDSVELREEKGAKLVGSLFADPITRALAALYEAIYRVLLDANRSYRDVVLEFIKAESAVRYAEEQMVDPAITAFSMTLARADGKENYESDRYKAVFKQPVSYYRSPRERDQEKKLTELVANARAVVGTDDVVAAILPRLETNLTTLGELLNLFDEATERRRKAEEVLNEAVRKHDLQWAAAEGEVTKLYPQDRKRQRSYFPSLRKRTSKKKTDKAVTAY